MKLLFLAPYLPSPPQSGAPRRVHGLMSELARRHDVSLLAFTVPGEDTAAAIAATSQYCSQVVTVEGRHLDRALGGSRKRRLQLRTMFGMKSFERLAYYDAGFQRELDRLIEHGEFDVITTEHAQMACYRLPHTARLVLDEHNIEYDILRRTTSAERASVRKIYSWVNFLKLRNEERAAWEQFDGVTLTSERDELVLCGDAPGTRTAVIPNGVDTEFFAPSETPVDADTILFFGAINYYPNTEGLLYFLDEVFPLVKREHPGVKFMIVGQQPPPAIAARAAEDVIVTGLVDDVRPYLERAAVVIAPLRIGGGTRLKIVEAMSMGKAIVATTLGAEGLDVSDGENILLADTPDEFASQVTRALRDPRLTARLGRAARKRAEEQYSWKGVVDRLERFYAELPSPSAQVKPVHRMETKVSDRG